MHIKDNLHFIGLLILVTFFFGACGKKESKDVPVAKPPTQVSQPVASPDIAEEEKETPVYVYSGDRFRDPFLEVGQTTIYQPDAIFNPERAKVNAIIYSPKLRSGIIEISGSGSYFVNGTKIIDIMGKNVKGYRAKVFMDKIVITSEENDIYELRIRINDEVEDDEEAT